MSFRSYYLQVMHHVQGAAVETSWSIIHTPILWGVSSSLLLLFYDLHGFGCRNASATEQIQVLAEGLQLNDTLIAFIKNAS